MPDVQLNDIGVVFELQVLKANGDVETGLGSVTVKEIHFEKPSGDLLEKDASFVTNGSEGKIQYTSVAGDLSEIGTWNIQGYFENANGKWYTSVRNFNVLKNAA